MTCFRELVVRNCPRIHKLPDSLRSMQRCLEELDVSGCNLMAGAIPDDLWCLFSLESLNNWYEDNNFLGFALLCHLVPVDDDDDDDDGYGTFRLLISDGDQFGHVEPQNIVQMNNTLFADPALRVVYFPQIAISSEYRSNGWNKFEAGFSCKVESCGIHLIYDHGQDHAQQSLQLFNVKRSHDDTKDHPHV
ncbi:hypothetical protein AAG906_038868 [Vitis piasezkii]